MAAAYGNGDAGRIIYTVVHDKIPIIGQNGNGIVKIVVQIC